MTRNGTLVFAIAATVANLIAMAVNVYLAGWQGQRWQVVMLPVSAFAIGVVWWSWLRYGRHLTGERR